MTTRHDDDSVEDRAPAWRRYTRFWRADAGGDVSDEVAFHIESTIEELVASGVPRDEARAIAQRKFGDVQRISQSLYTLSRQRERTMARTEWTDTLRNDLTFGLRQLRKSPGFTAVAIVTLALGIGANSAIFSVVHSVLLQPLPYANNERILAISEKSGQGRNVVSLGNFATWRREARSFEALGALWGSAPLTLTGVGDPTPVSVIRTNADYWRAIYIPPVLGRYFREEEVQEGAAPIAILSQGLWERRFNRDSNIVGKSITLAGVSRTVVGIAPAGYILYPPAEQVWVPLILPAARWNDHSDHELSVFGLVRSGVSIAQATRELSAIERALAKEYPKAGFEDIDTVPITESVVGDQRKTLLTLMGAVALVLFIACANVANLMIARASSRRAEIAVRGALGASRGRIVAQLLTESLLLALAGGALGLLVAWQGVRFLVTSPAYIPRLQNATLNGTAVLFTLGVSVLCAVLFGLVPALRASRLDLQKTLRDGGRQSASISRERLRSALVIGELCLTQILLVGAALLIRSNLAAQAVPPGFSTNNLLLFNVMLPSARYGAPGALEGGFQQLDAGLAAIPGAQVVGRTSLAPIHGGGWNCGTIREGGVIGGDGSVVANMRSANETYFSAIGATLVRGRAFTRADGADAPGVAIITRGLATALFGDADPIGRRISTCTDGNEQSRKWREVVGVIGDMRANGLTRDVPREVFMPSAQWPANSQMTFVVRGSVPVATLLPAIRRAVATVDPLLALSRVQTMDEAISLRLAYPRFSMWLLTLLGMTGLVVAVIGVYGVISFFVHQRTHELGVRLALGASVGRLQWMVVQQGLILGLAGVAIGAVASYMAARLLQSLVFGISVHDAVTFVGVAALLAAVAVLASYLPARRATRINPVNALRGG